MNRHAQWVLLAGCASVCVNLDACAHDATSKDAYEVPEHIRERETLRQDPYAEPRPNNAPIDPHPKGFFNVPDPGATITDDSDPAEDSSLDRHREEGAQP